MLGLTCNVPQKAVRRPLVDYETLVWFVYGVLTILACVDRFTLNIWPRQTHTIGAGPAGKDFIDGIKDGPWSVAFYDIIARISGRYSILALNLLLFTMMRSTAAALSESWIARNLIDFSNIFDANLRLHKWNGIALAVLTLVHVWSIVFPCIFNGWKAKVVAGSFEWFLSERKPSGFTDVDLANETMGLQVDDVFRIVEMTILLAILLPLSIRWMCTRWHLGIHVHRFIAVIYFIDIVRRHTHPHSWFLNTPFFLAWLADNAVGVYWRRREEKVYRMRLSDDYMLLFWNQSIQSNTVGPKYYLRLANSSLMEHAHVFTGFENRRDLDIADGNSWSACLLIRIYHNKRRPRLGRKDVISHTHRVAEASDPKIVTWGPFHGSMSENARLHLQSGKAITLVAGGSAAGYVLDAVQLYDIDCSGPLTVFYTCRDSGLFSWFLSVITTALHDVGSKKIQVVAALTSGGQTDESLVEKNLEKQYSTGGSSGTLSKESPKMQQIRVQHGRIDFFTEILAENVVFFQGSGGLQRVVAKACKANGSRFVAGPAFDQDPNKQRNWLNALKLTRRKERDDLV
eukprot:GFKZ01013331.1.p1 GENE.GFKZ01013331.1~~GFKZ01013331.1.p1  ORF type:complete len:571 (-),score=55.47 GFKZ01013331.1:195-1907(-)